MAKKRRCAHSGPTRLIGGAAHAALSREARSLLSGLHDIAESAGRDRDPILVEVEPGRFVQVRLSEEWRKLGSAAPGSIEHARRLVDLAEAAFEAERVIKQ
jgi:hypothetical protein